MWSLLWSVGCSKAPSATLDAVALSDRADPVAHLEPQPLLEGVVADDSGPVETRTRALVLLETHVDPSWASTALDGDSVWLRRAALEALPSPTPTSVRARVLAAAEEDGDPFVRAAAARAIGAPEGLEALRSRPCADVLPCALAALQLGDAGSRSAVEAALSGADLPMDLPLFDDLGAARDAGLAAALAVGQDRADPELALVVARARVSLGDASAAAVFREALARDADEERRAEAIDLLATLADPAATELLQVAARDEDPFLAAYARLASVGAGTGDARWLSSAFSEGDPELRQLAVRAAGRALARGDRKAAGEAREVVGLGLLDPHGLVRAEAARVAGEARLAELGPAVRPLLDDEWAAVRVEAAGALLALGAVR